MYITTWNIPLWSPCNVCRNTNIEKCVNMIWYQEPYLHGKKLFDQSIFKFLKSDIHRIHILEMFEYFLYIRSSHAVRIMFYAFHGTLKQITANLTVQTQNVYIYIYTYIYICSNTTVIDRAHPSTRLKSLYSFTWINVIDFTVWHPLTMYLI